jgi:hypothetical protein
MRLEDDQLAEIRRESLGGILRVDGALVQAPFDLSKRGDVLEAYGHLHPWCAELLYPGVQAYLERRTARGCEAAVVFLDRTTSPAEPLVILGDARTARVSAPVNWNCVDLAELLSELRQRGFRAPVADGGIANATAARPRSWAAWCEPFGFRPGCLTAALAARAALRRRIGR